MADQKEKTEAVAEEAKTDVAVAQPGGEIVASEEMSFEDELLADAGAGSENIDLKHLTVPFLTILQQLSPQVQKGGPEYIQGAEAGDIMNTLTKKLYKANRGEANNNGICVAAVMFEPKAIEWKPRGQGGGGGLIRVWGDDNSYMNHPDYQFSKEKNRWISREGNEVTDHYDTYVNQYGYFDEKNELIPEAAQGILSCKGSQIKKAKGWNAERMMLRVQVGGRSINPPGWYRTYRVRTQFESNDKGSWFGWVIEPHEESMKLPNGRDFYGFCKSTWQSIHGGELKADEGGRMADVSAGGLADGAEIPF